MAVKRERQELTIDPALQAHMGKGIEKSDPLFGKMAEQRERLRKMTPGQRKKALLDRQRHKATYDLPLEIIEAVQELAKKLDCPPAHVAALLLRCGLQQVETGEVDPADFRRAANTPRYTWFLDYRREDE